LVGELLGCASPNRVGYGLSRLLKNQGKDVDMLDALRIVV